MKNVLYFLEDRIPETIRRLVISDLVSRGYSCRVCSYQMSEETIFQGLKWADCVLFAPGRFLEDRFFKENRHIRLMQLWSSGYDKFNVLGAHSAGIPVANNGGANAISVAEHTLMLMLAASRKMSDCLLRVRLGIWQGNSHGYDMRSLYGKTLGVFGAGKIGKEVLRRARAFGMRLTYFDTKRMSPSDESALGVSFLNFSELLCSADILTLHLHLNENTRGIINHASFNAMKEGVIVINTARAELIEQQALVANLKNGKILGLGADVFYEEPTTGFEGYLGYPNVCATPHTAGSTLDTYALAISSCLDNFDRVSRDERPLWLI